MDRHRPTWRQRAAYIATTALVASTIVIVGGASPVAAAGQATLTTKNVAPSTTAAAPASGGDNLAYSIGYGCSGTNADDECFDAVVTDVLPTFTDIYGNVRQLEFVSAGSSEPDDWTFNGVTGTEPNRVVSWTATGSAGGDCNADPNVGLCAGDSGTLFLQLRVPPGLVPEDPTAQLVTNQASIDLDAVIDLSDNGPACAPVTETAADPCGSYINATATTSGITKSGPASVLLNAAGSDPVDYTIDICAATGAALWPYYTVTDVLPVGATVVGALPFGGTVTDAGAPSMPGATEDDPPIPGTGATITWNLSPANHPAVGTTGCLRISFQVEFVNATTTGDLTNVIGESKTNTVSATGSDDGVAVDQDLGSDDTTLTLTGPVTRFGPAKGTGGNYYVQNGDTVTYSLGASNTSDAEALPFSTATLTDGPLPTFTGGQFTLTQIDTGTWPGATATVTASIETSPDGTTWTQVATAPSTSITTGLASVRYVRWVFSSVGADAIGPGWSSSGQRLIGTVTGTPPAPPASDIQTNCVGLTGTQGGVLQNRGTRCAPVELEQPQPHPSITKTAPGSIEPGETITYTLTAANDADATGNLVDPQITDCVPFSSHLVVSNVVLGAGWSIESGPTPGSCTPTAPATAGSGTFIQLQYTGILTPGDAAPVVRYDVTAHAYEFPTVADQPTPPGIYTNTATITQGDDTSFNHCVQDDCEASHTVIVPVVAQLQSVKLVQGTLDVDFNRAGTTTPGGEVLWKVSVRNRGNVPVENVQYVDIFPGVGDTGVVRTDQNRGSEYDPYLIEPIDAPAGWTVEYSLSTNPCRPEVLGPASGCEAPAWTTTPDLGAMSLYRAIRLTFSGQIAVGDQLEFTWEMTTPVFDPTYDTPDTTADPYDQLQDCTIPLSDPAYPAVGGGPGNTTLVGARTQVAAWIDNGAGGGVANDGIQQAGEGGPTCPRASNSFAYGVDVPAAAIPPGVPDPGRVGAEPPKVDLHVAAPPAANTIGNRVWEDFDNDGIQDTGEPGISDVRVDLLDGLGNLLDTTYTDPSGNYLFDGLPDGDYQVRFYMPDEIGYISPRDRTGFPGDQALNSANTDDDSDIPQAPTGSNAAGNFFDAVVVTLGNDVGGSGSEVDPTWDAGIWIPKPSILLKKYVNGSDAQTTATDPNIPKGAAVTWTYDITNTGNSYLSGVGLTDDVTISSQSDPVPTCNWAGSSDPLTPANVLARGETVSCTATGTAITGQYGNNATVVGTPTLDDGTTPVAKTGVPPSVSDQDPAHYFGVEYDLALTKVANVTTVADGGSVTWTIRVRNQGNVSSGAYTVTDVIPLGMDYVSSSGATLASQIGRTLTYNRPSLAAGATSSFTIVTSVSDINQRPFRNWAEISADSSATYGTTDFDSTPDTLVGDDNGAGTNLGVAPNDAVTNHNLNGAGPTFNFDSNAATPLPGGALDEDDNDFEQVAGNVAYDLALIKTVAPPTVGQDGLVTWNIRAANQGNVGSGTFTVRDVLPNGMTFVSATPSPDGNPSAGVYTWDISNLAPGATSGIAITTRATDLLQRPFRNWAEITADSAASYNVPGTTVVDEDSTPDTVMGNDPGPGTGNDPNDLYQNHNDITFDSGTPTGFPGVDEDDSDYEDVSSDPVYDLALAKITDTSTVAFDGEPIWRTRVYNQGNVRSGPIVVTDKLPTGLTYVSGQVFTSGGLPLSGASCGPVTFTVTCSIPDVAVADFVDVVIVTSITGGDLSTAPWRNWAEISSDSAQTLYGIDDLDSTPDTETGRDGVLSTNDNYVGVATLGATYAPGPGFNDPSVDQDDHDDAVVLTTGEYDLALIKTADDATVLYTDPVDFTITVQNQGNVPSGSFVVVDQVPLGLQPTAVSGGTWSAIDRTITWTIPNLAAGATASRTYTATISDITLRPFRNQAEISSDSAQALYGIDDVDSTPDTDPANDGSYPAVGAPPGTDTDNLLIGEAGTEGEEDDADIADVNVTVVYDLALVKVVDATDLVTNGVETGSATFTITVENQGTVPSNDFVVTDWIPDGIEPVLPIAAGGSWDAGSRTITWTIANLVPSASTTREFTVTVSDITERVYRNVAEITADSADDYSTGSETVADVDSTPDTDPTNDGTYPPLGSPPGTGIDNIDITEAGVDSGDPQDDADIADLSFDVTYDLALIKVADAALVAYDDTITFTVTVQNQGNVDSNGFTITDTIPGGLTPVLPIPDSGTWNPIAGTITWSIANLDGAPNLNPGESTSVSYAATISDIAQRPFRNFAEISADSADDYDSALVDVEDIDSIPDADTTNDGTYPAATEFPTPGDGIDNLVITEAGVETGDPQDDADIADVGVDVLYDLQLVKTSDAAVIEYDDTVTFTLAVLNQGTVPSGTFTVTDWIPAGMAVVDAGGGVESPGMVAWTITDSLDPGESTTIEFALEISDITLRPYRNVAEISADSADDYDVTGAVVLDVSDVDSIPDADPVDDVQDIDQTAFQPGVTGFNDPAVDSDDHDFVPLTVDVEYDLALAKVVDDTDLIANGIATGIATFTVTVQNQGNVPSNRFTVTDRVPVGIEPGAISSGGVWDAVERTIVWTVTQLNPGATRVRTYEATVIDLTMQPFRNYAEISADSADEYSTATDPIFDIDSIPNTAIGDDGGYPPLLSDPGTGIDNLAISEAGNDGLDDEDDADIADLVYPVVYDLALAKVTGAPVIEPDGTATFTVTVRNQGNVDSGEFTIFDRLPAGLILISNGGGIYDATGHTITWTVTQLAPGESARFDVTMQVDDISLRPYRNLAEISTDSADDYDAGGVDAAALIDVEDADSVPDANANNDGTYGPRGASNALDNTGSGAIDQAGVGPDAPPAGEDDADIADVDVEVDYDLALVKRLPPGQSYPVGAVINFAIDVKNQGNVDSGPFTFADVVPPGMSFVSASTAGAHAAGVVTWTISNLPPGEKLTVTLGLRLDDATRPAYVNYAEIVTDSADDYSSSTQQVTDDDSVPDTNVLNDLTVPTDDVDVDQVVGDEDDHDLEMLDTAQIRLDNAPPPLPRTGSNIGNTLVLAIMAILLGSLLLRTRRRPTI